MEAPRIARRPITVEITGLLGVWRVRHGTLVEEEGQHYATQLCTTRPNYAKCTYGGGRLNHGFNDGNGTPRGHSRRARHQIEPLIVRADVSTCYGTGRPAGDVW